MRARTFPFSPHTATALEVGDIIPVPGTAETWACLQVLELQPRTRVNFVVGLLPWRGLRPPTVGDVDGLVPMNRALTRIEIFTKGGLQVAGNVPPNDAGQERWYGPLYVGRTTSVWGWIATMRIARYAAANTLSDEPEAALEQIRKGLIAEPESDRYKAP